MVRRGKQREQLGGVVRLAPVANDPVAERARDHPNRVLHPGMLPGVQVSVVRHGLFVVTRGQLRYRAATTRA